MKAAILYEQNKPLKIEELIIPELKEGQVLVKLVASGLCHSQLNEIKGRKGPDKYLPHTLGHEGAGIVEEVGAKVTKVKKGDYVVLSWIKGKGINAAPPLYLCGDRKINSGQLSTFNEYTVTAENRVTSIKKEIPLELASLLGCAVSTGMGSVLNIAKLKSGETIAVFGAGGIGLSAIHAAAISGASKIIAVDIVEAKLNLAKELGATHVIDASNVDVVRTIKELTGNNGVDHAIESAGLGQTMEQAFECVRIGGGKAIIVGNLPAGHKIAIDPFALICGKQIIGSWGGEAEPDRDIPKFVDLYLEGKLKLEKMLTHRFKLNEINEAFAVLEKGEAGRVIVIL
ncbi:MAG: zinc-binding dehydrogenase [Candidatus Margulisbacteria bacterium]|nr:zinc-binding dehydrogenase [Candidatus Margulisiibacteriota bacterium]